MLNFVRFDFLAYAKLRLDMFRRARDAERASQQTPIMRVIPRKRDMCLTTILGALVGGTVAAIVVHRMTRR